MMFKQARQSIAKHLLGWSFESRARYFIVTSIAILTLLTALTFIKLESDISARHALTTRIEHVERVERIEKVVVHLP